MTGNLHTHSMYCDGKDSLSDIVSAAIEKGFDYIGFSGHSYTPFDTSYCMTEENTEKYFFEIGQLKEQYRGKINIYRGIEKDLFAAFDNRRYDFEIGSVHYLCEGGSYYPVDESAEILVKTVENVFGGDPYKYARSYFEFVSTIKSPIIGHFDLVTKFNDIEPVFSENDPRYKEAALQALEKLMQRGCVFEVNTGAMARGLKNKPYPSEWILKEIKRRGGRVIVTSDCHSAEKLDYAFKDTQKMLKGLGFEEGVQIICPTDIF